MKVLFVTLRALEINSSVTISNIGLLKGLLELGCDVDLLMPTVNSSLKQYDSFEEIINKVNVIRIKNNIIYERLVTGKQYKLKKFIVNIIRELFYKISMFDNTIKLVGKANISALKGKEYDLIISTSDPKTSHLYVDRLIKQGIKYRVWLQHWGDPLSIDITRKNIYPKILVKMKEKQIFSNADLIIYVSPLTEKIQRKIFLKYKKKMHFIPLPYIQEKIYNKPHNEILTIGYFGDYNSKVRDIMPLYNLCIENPNYRLIIAGSSDIRLKEKSNIQILPRVGEKQLNDLESKSDILVCICNKSGTQIPGKVYYYSATDKPILVLLDGENKDDFRDFLNKYNRFEICENDTNDINKILKEFSTLESSFMPCKDFSSIEVVKNMLSLVYKIQETKGCIK